MNNGSFLVYNFVVSKYLVHCNSYQPSFQFPMYFYYDDIDHDDISWTVKEVIEAVNIYFRVPSSLNVFFNAISVGKIDTIKTMH